MSESTTTLAEAEPADGPYFRSREAAAYLKFTERHVRLLAEQGKLAHIRIGRSLRFRRIDLDSFMAAHLVEARGSMS